MILAVDAGGTYYRAGLYENDTAVKTFFTHSESDDLCSWIEGIFKENETITKVCIGYAGQVHKGVIFSSPNIKVDRADIKAYLEEKYNIKVLLQNDLSCAVLAEAAYYKTGDICALYLGTGMGLGVVSSGSLLKGCKNMAAELGHIPYKEAPFSCGCGKNNCLELFASGEGVAKFKRHLHLDDNITLQQLKNSTDVKEKNIYEEFEKALLQGVATAITLFNPCVLVIGGGIIKNYDELFDTVLSKYKNFTMPVLTQDVRIVKTQIDNAVLTGALLLKDEDE